MFGLIFVSDPPVETVYMICVVVVAMALVGVVIVLLAVTIRYLWWINNIFLMKTAQLFWYIKMRISRGNCKLCHTWLMEKIMNKKTFTVWN